MAAAGSTRLFLSAADLSEATIARLAHPRTGHTMSVARAGDALLELQHWTDGQPHSWLIAGAEKVLREGDFYVATPLDPLFLLLPHLRRVRGSVGAEHKGYFRPLSELVSGADDEAALEATVLALPSIAKRLRTVCEVKDDYDEPMLRLSDHKELGWLRRKTAAVHSHLASDANILAAAAHRTAAAHTSQFDDDVAAASGSSPAVAPVTGGTGSTAVALADAEAHATALALVCEYLGPEAQATLCAVLKLDEELVRAQRGAAKRPVAPSLVQASSMDSTASSTRTVCAAMTAEDEAAAAPPPAKKQKAAAAPAAKSKLPVTLKKGQTTMASFFAKPKK